MAFWHISSLSLLLQIYKVTELWVRAPGGEKNKIKPKNNMLGMKNYIYLSVYWRSRVWFDFQEIIIGSPFHWILSGQRWDALGVATLHKDEREGCCEDTCWGGWHHLPSCSSALLKHTRSSPLNTLTFSSWRGNRWRCREDSGGM